AVEQRGLRRVAISGGCALNRILITRLTERLQVMEIQTLLATRTSPGDGGIALGQASVARTSIAPN
ncbi:MAG TPA: carbamoyltransferase HypF, partial [Rhodocyclaceae bacterium]|nr:carbamoyltransferase HypF [Rhodocyclaceae bacterium]